MTNSPTISQENNRLKQKAARSSVISNSLLVVLKLTVGIISGSVSILSEAIHSGIDLIASGIDLYSVKESGKPADAEHNFGHGKIENVAGTIEALLIFIAAIYIIYAAIIKLINGNIEIGHLGLGTAIMAVSALVNYFVSRNLMKVAIKTDSIALEADALHLRTDVFTSLGVFIGLILIKITGIHLFDPIIAILVAAMIIKAAWDLTKNSFFNILDVKLSNEEEEIIRNIMNNFTGKFHQYHKLRTRKSGYNRHIDLHIIVPPKMTVEEGHSLSHEISDAIKEKLPYSHVLIHVEPCNHECDDCKSVCERPAIKQGDSYS
ncbi:MAG: cation diffusion facilitator family transporter [Desulfuromonadales bacterium]|nr:cation diffusion facilitator family transporter [Desulfuromonadales bacterium]